LERLYCSSNQLTSLPESFGSLSSLKSLSCYNNKLTSLPESFASLSSLEELWCSNNSLTSLPLSLVNCINLRNIEVENNLFDEHNPVITRLLNRLRQIRTYGIYNDQQSVHNHQIQDCIRNSIVSIMNDKDFFAEDKVFQQILEVATLVDKTKSSLFDYSTDMSEHSSLFITFKELLLRVWTRIQTHEKSKELKEILNSEISDALCMCFTGRLSRLVNCLAGGFFPDVVIEIASNEQISNVIISIKRILEEQDKFTEDLHKELAEKELKERNYPQDEIDIWLSYI
jgi:hypothetical protein